MEELESPEIFGTRNTNKSAYNLKHYLRNYSALQYLGWFGNRVLQVWFENKILLKKVGLRIGSIAWEKVVWELFLKYDSLWDVQKCTPKEILFNFGFFGKKTVQNIYIFKNIFGNSSSIFLSPL